MFRTFPFFFFFCCLLAFSNLPMRLSGCVTAWGQEPQLRLAVSEIAQSCGVTLGKLWCGLEPGPPIHLDLCLYLALLCRLFAEGSKSALGQTLNSGQTALRMQGPKNRGSNKQTKQLHRKRCIRGKAERWDLIPKIGTVGEGLHTVCPERFTAVNWANYHPRDEKALWQIHLTWFPVMQRTYEVLNSMCSCARAPFHRMLTEYRVNAP